MSATEMTWPGVINGKKRRCSDPCSTLDAMAFLLGT
jgi:hypothetical protein